MKVNLVYNRIPHHAGHSGYDQIARYLGGRVPVESFEGDVPRLIPWQAWEWMVNRSADWIARRSGMDWYDPYSLTLEARSAFRLLRGNREIYHILYGENTYRYLGSLSRIAGWKASRIVCTYHQPPQIFNKVIRCKSILKRLDAVIAVASNQADYFASFVEKEKVFVVPHGVDTDYFHPIERNGSDGMVCLFVGQWLRDFNMLGAVIQRVGASAPWVKFRIVASKDNGALFAGLKNLIVLDRLSDPELLEAYQNADALLLPVTDCTANNALLEGLSCGLPIVTTDVGGIRDYLDSACAFLIPPGDVDAMCEAVLKLASDTRLRAEMSHQSRARALRFDWRQTVEKLIGVYHALTG